jgi:HNH endonuclease
MAKLTRYAADTYAVVGNISAREIAALESGKRSTLVRPVGRWDVIASWRRSADLEKAVIPILFSEVSSPELTTWAAEVASIRITGERASVAITRLGRLRSAVQVGNLQDARTGLGIRTTPLRSDVPCMLSRQTVRVVRARELVELGDTTLVEGSEGAASEVGSDPATRGLRETVVKALINARLGQGGYRKRMSRVWGGRCAVTECRVGNVLIASHAKPWSESTTIERLDEYNGLLLAAHLDRLFDSGLIAFGDAGQMLFSRNLTKSDRVCLGIDGKARLRFVHERHAAYLQAHRLAHGFE